MTAAADLFPGFESVSIDVGGVTIFARVGGAGPPLLMLHGYPQTHMCWHRVAMVLASEFTVVCPDLRGSGRSGCPPSDMKLRAYSKKIMAEDVFRLMQALGFSRFCLMGHGRGAWVGYRLALDVRDAVERLVIVDVLSVLDQLRLEKEEGASEQLSYQAFMAQPAPLPESLIGANPGEWVEARLKRGTACGTLLPLDSAALNDYLMCHSDPDRIHASCEDHRAGTSRDVDDDREAYASGKRIVAPVLLVWGDAGALAKLPDPLAFWRPWCGDLRGARVRSGHFIAEENPDALLESALPFLRP